MIKNNCLISNCTHNRVVVKWKRLTMVIKTERLSRGFPPTRKNGYEREAWQQKNYICGIDEVGRGCLAGPLVTAAVILPINKTSSLLQDSKLLTAGERLKGAVWIMKNCWYAYGIVNHRTIDRHNIWQATLIAMKKALVNLLATSPSPSAILIDAMPLKLTDTGYNDIPVHHFPKGECKSSSIAAASIIAKVKRDEMMVKFASLFPGFDLQEHKGYSTKKHKAILLEEPPLIIHRRSFLHHIETINDYDECQDQQTIC
jgi:ribonuclease HII